MIYIYNILKIYKVKNPSDKSSIPGRSVLQK